LIVASMLILIMLSAIGLPKGLNLWVIKNEKH